MQSPSLSLRILAAVFWSVLWMLILGAPILASRSHFSLASWIYLVFSNVCHQMPDRSFFIANFPLAVCHRCAGIYLGFVLGSLFKNPFLYRSTAIRRVWILASTIPLILDALLPFAGIGAGSAGSRFLTGLLFGTMLSSLLLHGIMELSAGSRLRLHLRGGIK